MAQVYATCLPSAEGTVWLPSLRRERDDWGQMLAALGRLYTDGAQVNWAQVDDCTRRPWVDLPTYPFERFRYWVDRIVPTRLPPIAEATPVARASNAVAISNLVVVVFIVLPSFGLICVSDIRIDAGRGPMR